MKYSRSRFVTMNVDLPDEIRTRFLRNSIDVTFDSLFYEPQHRDGVTLDQAIEWIQAHNQSIFSMVKQDQILARFYFYESIDLDDFEAYLQGLS